MKVGQKVYMPSTFYEERKDGEMKIFSVIKVGRKFAYIKQEGFGRQIKIDLENMRRVKENGCMGESVYLSVEDFEKERRRVKWIKVFDSFRLHLSKVSLEQFEEAAGILGIKID